jgi:hypothetical protein
MPEADFSEEMQSSLRFGLGDGLRPAVRELTSQRWHYRKFSPISPQQELITLRQILYGWKP